MSGCGCKKKNTSVSQSKSILKRKLRFVENEKPTQTAVKLTPDQEKQVNDIINKINQLK